VGVSDYVTYLLLDKKMLEEDHQSEVEALQRKVSELQTEYKAELTRTRPAGGESVGIH